VNFRINVLCESNLQVPNQTAVTMNVLLFLASLGVTFACPFALPSFQLLAHGGSRSGFQGFNVPLFDSSDCRHQVPAGPVYADGSVALILQRRLDKLTTARSIRAFGGSGSQILS